MTRSVLFVWELGEGLGHVSRLIRIADRLRQQGVLCRFAVRQLELAGRAVQNAGFDILQAPLARVEAIRGPDGTQPVTVGDILGAVGFGSVDRLAPTVAGWHTLIELVAPDVVVSDYAPTANLALFGGPVPWVPIGDGFTLPPFETEHFLPFRNSRPAFDETQILDAVAAVQAERGRPCPERLPLLFEGTRRFVVTLPELDPWHRARSVHAIGPVADPPRPVDVPPVEDYFAYLSTRYAFTERVLEGLVASGRKGSLFLRDATPAQRTTWRERGLTVWDRPQDMRAMAERASVIIHHAGVGTAEQVLALGRPQMLVPRHFEQLANTESLGRLGVAVALRSNGRFTVADVGGALAMTIEQERFRHRAATCARVLAGRAHRAQETVAAACLELMAR